MAKRVGGAIQFAKEAEKSLNSGFRFSPWFGSTSTTFVTIETFPVQRGVPLVHCLECQQTTSNTNIMY